MKNIFVLLLLAMMIFSCNENSSDECIDASKKKETACPFNYDPVCGCNGVTYGNECAANGAGVKTWAKGECEK